MLLTSDLHLTDKKEDTYRWEVFDNLLAYVHPGKPIVILGDLCDRADRHPGALVNRLVEALTRLTQGDRTVTILCGNHDRQLAEVPYWTFLSTLPNVIFVTKPMALGKLLLLPYSANPAVDWQNIPFGLYQCVMMHQTVAGVVTENGRTLEAPNMIRFPDNNIVYSGDIHIPGVVGQVTYVGSPHPIKFGDNYRCRFLRLDSNYKIIDDITLRKVRKAIIEISSIDQLKDLQVDPGDQGRVRFTMPANEMGDWPAKQLAITEWAKNNDVTLASVEAIVATSPDPEHQIDSDANPEQVLKSYCQIEGVEEAIYQTGLDILKNHQPKP